MNLSVQSHRLVISLPRWIIAAGLTHTDFEAEIEEVHREKHAMLAQSWALPDSAFSAPFREYAAFR
jgi:hypothetical protein